MKRHWLLTTLVTTLYVAACTSGPGVYWDGKRYSLVEGKAAIPDPIRASLRMDEAGLRGVAEAGQHFNTTDSVTDSTLPFRRLVGAGRSREYWLVVLDHGGYQRVFEAYVFNGAQLEKQWKHFWFPNQTFPSVVKSKDWWVPK